MNTPTIGSHMHFEHEGKTLCGTIKHILPCLENGRKHAVIELDGSLRGCMYKANADRLKHNRNRIAHQPNEIADLAQPRFKRYTAKHTKRHVVPLDELTCPPILKFIFCSGLMNPFNSENNNRRFRIIQESDRVFPL